MEEFDDIKIPEGLKERLEAAIDCWDAAERAESGDVQIPEGLEKRLEAAIDRWDAEEHQQSELQIDRPRFKLFSWKTAAACIAILLGFGLWKAFSNDNIGGNGQQMAAVSEYDAAIEALALLSETMGTGLAQLESAMNFE